ncbi:MFS general substrate transporter [Zopfia rhizophila CBS 207.26]|uniref:MFS general substrate transporter n=1 Tax=Zopfia rhizophila CBS 207.26 TaxID=1314779 RepID=A0A6A6EAZ4_9PEZI|nr:MFS general substrate transporter [Zopfia rhizophila CBS 207.26]
MMLFRTKRISEPSDQKVDLRIFPVLATCHLMQNLDKYALNYAAVIGLPKDFNLKENDFMNVTTAFFIAFMLAEVPNGQFVLQRTPRGLEYKFNVLAVGCPLTCPGSKMARLKNYLWGIPMVHKVRASSWFTLWYYGNAGAQTIGGLVSFRFQYMTGVSVSGWRTMFVVLGCLMVIVGVTTWIYIPATPMQARSLDNGEKVSLLKYVSVNETGIRNHRFMPAEIWGALRDPQIWLFSVAAMSLSSSSGVITTYSSGIIKQTDISFKEAALLHLPTGAVCAISVAIASYGIRHTWHRWAQISISALIGALGAGLMSFLRHDNKPGLLVKLTLIHFITATVPMIYHCITVNTSGYTKRSFATNVVVGKDAFEYQLAKIAVMATETGSAFVTCALMLYYILEKERRGKKSAERKEESDEETDTEAWVGLTDKRNTHFPMFTEVVVREFGRL